MNNQPKNIEDISDSQKSASIDARTNNAVSHTTVEESLAEIWCDIFEVDSINLDDDFFTMGGHSLLAIKMLFHIEETFSVKLSLDCLFDSPVLAELASEISQQIAKNKIST